MATTRLDIVVSRTGSAAGGAAAVAVSSGPATAAGSASSDVSRQQSAAKSAAAIAKKAADARVAAHQAMMDRVARIDRISGARKTKIDRQLYAETTARNEAEAKKRARDSVAADKAANSAMVADLKRIAAARKATTAAQEAEAKKRAAAEMKALKLTEAAAKHTDNALRRMSRDAAREAARSAQQTRMAWMNALTGISNAAKRLKTGMGTLGTQMGGGIGGMISGLGGGPGGLLSGAGRVAGGVARGAGAAGGGLISGAGMAAGGLAGSIGGPAGMAVGATIGGAVSAPLAGLFNMAGGVAAGMLSGVAELAGAVADKFVTVFKVGVAAVIGGAIYSTFEAIKIQPIQASFESMARSIGADPVKALNSLREALGGTISDFDMMLSFNRAVSLGAISSAEQFELLAVAAQRMARATGRDAKDALNDISVGLGRQSFRVLDNIGIIVRATDAYEKYAKKIGKTAGSLSFAERRIAFQTAAIEDLMRKQKAAGGETDNWSKRLDRLTSSFTNWRIEMGTKVLQALDKLLPGMERVWDLSKKIIAPLLADVGSAWNAVVGHVKGAIDAIGDYLQGSSLKSIWEDVKTVAAIAFESIIEMAKVAAAAIGDAISSGIKSGLSALVNMPAVSGALDTAKGVAGGAIGGGLAAFMANAGRGASAGAKSKGPIGAVVGGLIGGIGGGLVSMAPNPLGALAGGSAPTAKAPSVAATEAPSGMSTLSALFADMAAKIVAVLDKRVGDGKTAAHANEFTSGTQTANLKTVGASALGAAVGASDNALEGAHGFIRAVDILTAKLEAFGVSKGVTGNIRAGAQQAFTANKVDLGSLTMKPAEMESKNDAFEAASNATLEWLLEIVEDFEDAAHVADEIKPLVESQYQAEQEIVKLAIKRKAHEADRESSEKRMSEAANKMSEANEERAKIAKAHNKALQAVLDEEIAVRKSASEEFAKKLKSISDNMRSQMAGVSGDSAVPRRLRTGMQRADAMKNAGVRNQIAREYAGVSGSEMRNPEVRAQLEARVLQLRSQSAQPLERARAKEADRSVGLGPDGKKVRDSSMPEVLEAKAESDAALKESLAAIEKEREALKESNAAVMKAFDEDIEKQAALHKAMVSTMEEAAKALKQNTKSIQETEERLKKIEEDMKRTSAVASKSRGKA